MKKYLVSFIMILVMLSGLTAQQAIFKGIIVDEKSKEPVPFANVSLKLGYDVLKEVSTNFEGHFEINDIDPYTYRLVVSSAGFQQYILDSLVLYNGQNLYMEIGLKNSPVILEEFEVVDYKVPLIDKDKTQNDVTVTSEEIAKMPNHNAQSVNRNKKNKKQKQTLVVEDDVSIDYSANQITATEINDFSKWDLWENLDESEFAEYSEYWNIHLNERYVVEVVNEKNAPLMGLNIKLKNKSGTVIWESRTDNTGKAELWSFGISIKERKRLICEIELQDGNIETIKPDPFSKSINKIRINGECESSDIIDIAFMVDATGSMGDEIDFLKNDLIDIIQNTKEVFPDKEINMGSVFYRCKKNEYETRLFDLTNDIEKGIQFIRDQGAGEGGDELVSEALVESINNLSWNEEEASVKILFLVLDQQPNNTPLVNKKLKDSFKEASRLGIRIVPVVASAETKSTATTLEYLMRTIALATNGTNLFLTDHSGIGNSHATPKTDEIEVEYLNEAIKRIIYQYTYVVDCESTIDKNTAADTTFVFPKKVVAIEVVDSSISVQEKERKISFIDLSDGEGFTSMNESESLSSFENEDEYPIGVKFYPNPTSGPITIEARGKINEFYIFDISGKIILLHKLDGKDKTKINLNNWSRGIYFLKYQIDGKWFSGKIILGY